MPPQMEVPDAIGSPQEPHELNTGADGVGLTEPHTEPLAPKGQLRLYVAVLLMAPFLYIVLCVLIMRSDRFVQRAQNVYVTNMGYGLKLKNADCQVVIYGDSSAMVGVDPATVERLSHLTVCNIADFAGMLRVNGTVVLDEYLAHNKRPRYLLIMLAPEDLATAWRHDGNFEAVLMHVRRKLDVALVRTILQHPEDMLSSIENAGRLAPTWLVKRPLSRELRTEREQTRGRFPDPMESREDCNYENRINRPDRKWTDNLRARYGVDGTQVLIDVSPVPTCEPGLAEYRSELTGTGIVDNQILTFPIRWYTVSGRLHLGPDGVRALSEVVGTQISQLAQVKQLAQINPPNQAHQQQQGEEKR